MPSIPTGRRVFLDTNVLLYAVTEHPGYGQWANVLTSSSDAKRRHY